MGSLVSLSVSRDKCSYIFSASTLGIHVSYTELGPQEVVPVSWIECPLALIPVHSNVLKKDLWITVSFDHVSLQTVITLVQRSQKICRQGTNLKTI